MSKIMYLHIQFLIRLALSLRVHFAIKAEEGRFITEGFGVQSPWSVDFVDVNTDLFLFLALDKCCDEAQNSSCSCLSTDDILRALL